MAQVGQCADLAGDHLKGVRVEPEVDGWIGDRARGEPVRPGLAMRMRMALNSLIGSSCAPMVVTVTPVVDWEARNGSELRAAEDALPHFLLTHPRLDGTVAALSLLR